MTNTSFMSYYLKLRLLYEMKNVKVMIIGLDGATWDLIKPWADEGKLPTFKKLMESGVWGNLESITMPAWASMVTGKNPGKIGAIHFLMREKYGYDFKPVRLNIDRMNPLWKMLNVYGKTTNLFYIPTILPNLRELKGMYIPGEFVFVDEELYHPPGVKTLIERFGLNEMPPDFKRMNTVEYIEWWRKNVIKHLRLILFFLNNIKDWDFLMYVIYSTDHLSHLFWKYIDRTHPYYEEKQELSEAILRYYKSLDVMLNRIVRLCESKGTFLFLVSDHGHGPLRKRVNLNRWLQLQGYLSVRVESKNLHKSISEIVKLKILSSSFVRSKLIHKLFRKFSKIKCFIKLFLSTKLSVSSGAIDWAHTVAYFSGYNGININLKGREPKGIVNLKNYEKLRNELINKLKTLKDPETNKNVVQRVWKREEIYHGEFVDRLPDILIEYTNVSEYESVFTFSDTIIRRELFYRPEDPPVCSAHTYNGILLVYGPEIKKGEKIWGAKIYDIVPTVLHIFGLPIPNDIDGRVLMEIFEEDSEFAKRKINYVNSSYYDKIMERQKLRAMIRKLKRESKI